MCWEHRRITSGSGSQLIGRVIYKEACGCWPRPHGLAADTSNQTNFKGWAKPGTLNTPRLSSIYLILDRRAYASRRGRPINLDSNTCRRARSTGRIVRRISCLIYFYRQFSARTTPNLEVVKPADFLCSKFSPKDFLHWHWSGRELTRVTMLSSRAIQFRNLVAARQMSLPRVSIALASTWASVQQGIDWIACSLTS